MQWRDGIFSEATRQEGANFECERARSVALSANISLGIYTSVAGLCAVCPHVSLTGESRMKSLSCTDMHVAFPNLNGFKMDTHC